MATLKHEEQLQKIFSNINDWLKFAEAKNFGLLTLNAAVVFGFTQINFGDKSIIEKSAYYVLFPFAAISFLYCLISLFPIVSKIERPNKDQNDKWVKKFIIKFSNWIDSVESFENIHFYGYLKDINEIEFEQQFMSKTGLKDCTFSQFEKELVTQILYNSRITWLKYQFFKIGAFFFLAGVIFFVVALPFFKFLG